MIEMRCPQIWYSSFTSTVCKSCTFSCHARISFSSPMCKVTQLVSPPGLMWGVRCVRRADASKGKTHNVCDGLCYCEREKPLVLSVSPAKKISHAQAFNLTLICMFVCMCETVLSPCTHDSESDIHFPGSNVCTPP